MTTQLALTPEPTLPLRLDFGCGKNKKEGFFGIDLIDFEGVDLVLDIGKSPWPWEDSSVDEAHCSHFVEHLGVEERIHFVNELYRVLKPQAKALLITPHAFSGRAYGDLTHKWPPVVEFWFFYLNKEWRAVNAPHNSFYTCDFEATWGNSIHPMIQTRNSETQQWALTFYKEAAQDTIATLVARK
jgi:SAM-dependent methyltransferase